MKRRASQIGLDSSDQGHKRLRTSRTDRLSRLTDELLLKVLSCLPASQLCTTQRLSHRFRRLGDDESLWRGLYYRQFVRPRLRWTPAIVDCEGKLNVASWSLDDLEERSMTDWKRRYRIKHNWSCGACHVRRVLLDERCQPSGRRRSIQVDMRDGIIFTADRIGIRAWAVKDITCPLDQLPFEQLASSPEVDMEPSTICTDSHRNLDGLVRICVGFTSGAALIFTFKLDQGLRFLCQLGTPVYKRNPIAEPNLQPMSTTAMTWPLVSTCTKDMRLKVYNLIGSASGQDVTRPTYSVQAHTTYCPISVSMRAALDMIIVTIAYSEWQPLSHCITLQEMRFSKAGHFLDSRRAWTGTHSILRARQRSPQLEDATILAKNTSAQLSLSYNHPYLLVSRDDRLLTLHVVTSTADCLSIDHGRTLWGHSRSIFGAHIGRLGKAVSSSIGNAELMIWDLEEEAVRRGKYAYEQGTAVRPDQSSTMPVVAGDTKAAWLGFDAEHVVVLDEKEDALTIYDFT